MHPFEHACTLAWKDGGLSRDGAKLLDQLQTHFFMSDTDRAAIEEPWLMANLPGKTRSGFGAGYRILSTWVKHYASLDSELNAAAVRSMGRRFSYTGISRQKMRTALTWLKPCGLDRPFLEGSWIPNGRRDLNTPPGLEPLDAILGITMEMEDASSLPSEPLESVTSQLQKAGSKISIDGPLPCIRLSSEWSERAQNAEINWFDRLESYTDELSMIWLDPEGIAKGIDASNSDLSISEDVISVHIRSILESGDIGGHELNEITRWRLGGEPIDIHLDSLSLSCIEDEIHLSLESSEGKGRAVIGISSNDEWPPKPPINRTASAITTFVAELLSLSIPSLPHQIAHAIGIKANAIGAHIRPNRIDFSLEEI